MSYVKTLVKFVKATDSNETYTARSPENISASRGIGMIAGDTEILWVGNIRDFPKWIHNARAYVYAARDEDIDTNDQSQLLNVYFVESVEAVKDSGRYQWRIRGRDATQAVYNTRITETFSEDVQYTVPGIYGREKTTLGWRDIEEKSYPNASLIIRTLLRNYFGATSEGGLEVNDYGVRLTKRDGTAFPTKGYSCDNKPFGEVLIDLSSQEYTGDGPYQFGVEISNDGTAFLRWQPAGSTKNHLVANYALDPDTTTSTVTIDSTNTRYAQRFRTRSLSETYYLKDKITDVFFEMRPGGSLQGYWTIEADSGGNPSGTALTQTDTITLKPVPYTISFNDSLEVEPSTYYWLVFYRTAGTGSFYATEIDNLLNLTIKAKYYNGSWIDDPLKRLSHAISILNESITIREEEGAIAATNILDIQTSRSSYDQINAVAVYCGEDPNGVPIIVDRVDANASFSGGMRTKYISVDLARKWIKEHPEPDDYESATIDGVTLEDYTDYVNLCRNSVRAEGWAVAGRELSKIAMEGKPKWEVNLKIRGNNSYYIGQGVKIYARNVDVSYQIYRSNFYVSGIQHNIGVDGWTTSLRLVEQFPVGGIE
ncbi:MAG: hypothetical protein ACTSPB_01680 [Candidatus Thorarchaeota archaeon]